MNQPVWKRRDCVSAQVDDALVLLDLETLRYHSLNLTAAAIWNLLETPMSTSAVAESLCERYEVAPERCAESVEKFLASLESRQLIQPTV
jgi:hypothetical protein